MIKPILYHTHNAMHSEDLNFWRGLAEEHGHPVLELGCGTGRVLSNLVASGISVVGLDNNFEYLDFLQRSINANHASLYEIKLLDFRSFKLGKRFPLIILPCNTMSTFNSQERIGILQSIHNHLAAEGRFVFSVPNPLSLLELPEEGEIELEDTFTHPETRSLVRVYSSWYKTTEKITFNWRYDHEISADNIEQFFYSTTHFLELPQHYLFEMSECGFETDLLYGDFEGSLYDPDAAYFIMVAKASQRP